MKTRAQALREEAAWHQEMARIYLRRAAKEEDPGHQCFGIGATEKCDAEIRFFYSGIIHNAPELNRTYYCERHAHEALRKFKVILCAISDAPNSLDPIPARTRALDHS